MNAPTNNSTPTIDLMRLFAEGLDVMHREGEPAEESAICEWLASATRRIFRGGMADGAVVRLAAKVRAYLGVRVEWLKVLGRARAEQVRADQMEKGLVALARSIEGMLAAGSAVDEALAQHKELLVVDGELRMVDSELREDGGTKAKGARR